MNAPNFVLMYVEKPLRSAEFYAALLDARPVEASPGFAMFVLRNGFKLGLWLSSEVEPKVEGRGSTQELVFQLDDDDAVDLAFADWSRRGIAIAQKPAKMDFGYTFVGLDPDGHRLRVYALAERPV